MSKIIPVILCGGTGTRLWPESRPDTPKQFLPLISGNSLLQQTLMRLEGIDYSQLLLVASQEHRFIVAEQLRQLGVDNAEILLEPCARDTAAAIAVAALKAFEISEQATLLVLAADHAIEQPELFYQALAQALPLAEQDRLVTFGVPPCYPETGYGYIRRGQALQHGYQIAQFVEKPQREIAEQFIATGDYFWNSGMFMYKAQTALQALAKYQPAIEQACSLAYTAGYTEGCFSYLDAELFATCPSKPFDKAVMELTDSGAVVPLKSAWSDIGAWDALWKLQAKDSRGNVSRGQVTSLATENCYLSAQKSHLATLGVRDLIVVEANNAILVADKSCAQQVKTLVDKLDQSSSHQHRLSDVVYRPWGHYQYLERGEGYLVKRLCVSAGQSLSLQLHQHRAEHWVVVKGSAKITRADETLLLGENQSTYIPVGVPHRLANSGSEDLEVIEVQSGSYLSEEDIIRFDDNYGRHSTD